MATRMYEVQMKIYEALSNISAPIFDYVPEGTPSPYITFGHMNSSDDSLADERITVALEIWSEAKGRKQVVSIMNDIEQALERDLELLSAIAIKQGISHREIIPHANGIYQGNISFEFHLEWSD